MSMNSKIEIFFYLIASGLLIYCLIHEEFLIDWEQKVFRKIKLYTRAFVIALIQTIEERQKIKAERHR